MPWAEYHDRAKMEWLFAPLHKFASCLTASKHNNDFNWFDLELVLH